MSPSPCHLLDLVWKIRRDLWVRLQPTHQKGLDQAPQRLLTAEVRWRSPGAPQAVCGEYNELSLAWWIMVLTSLVLSAVWTT